MKAAIVGCGSISSRWARVLADDQRIEITVLVDPDRQAIDRLRDRHALQAGWTATLDQAIETYDLEVVINLTPVSIHVPVIRTALEAGLHVLSEKPLATRSSDASQLVDLARRRGRLLAVMRNRSADPRFLLFRDLVYAYAAPPFAVTVETSVPLHVPGFRTGLSLPVTSDLAVHAFDQIRELIPAAVTEVSCTEIPLDFQGTHCALATIMLRFADGSVFSYRGGYTAQAGFRTSANGQWQVQGRDFAACWNGETVVTSRTGKDADPETRILPDALPGYRLCVNAMIDALYGAELPGGLGADALGSVTLLEAALASATARRPVRITELAGDVDAAD